MEPGFRDLIYEITFEIKHNRNFEKAAVMLKDNNISLEQLIYATVRLNIFDIAILGDHLIKIK